MDKDYSKHSQAQASALELCLPLLEKAAELVQLPTGAAGGGGGRPLVIAEFAASHGGNSGVPMMTLAKALRARISGDAGGGGGGGDAGSATAGGGGGDDDDDSGDGAPPALQLHVVFTDQPGNDWALLFRAAENITQELRTALPDVRVTAAAAAKSFYERTLPDGFVDVALSFTALHWQSRKAVRLSRTINPGCSKTPEAERELLKAHAVNDLRRFLRMRAREVRAGGAMVLTYVAYSDALPIDELVHHDDAQEVAEALVAAGRLATADLGLMAAPVYFLDEATTRQVYEEAEAAGEWRTLAMEYALVRSPVWARYERGEATAEDNAENYAQTWRQVMAPSMRDGLLAAQWAPDDVERLVDDFFGAMRQNMLRRPRPVQFPSVRVLLQRL